MNAANQPVYDTDLLETLSPRTMVASGADAVGEQVGVKRGVQPSIG